MKKQRYLKKYFSCENIPILTFADIYIYLIHNPSPYTRAIFS